MRNLPIILPPISYNYKIKKKNVYNNLNGTYDNNYKNKRTHKKDYFKKMISFWAQFIYSVIMWINLLNKNYKKVL